MLNIKGDGDLNKKLVEKRKEIGLTQKQLAKKVGISERYYQRIECANSSPSVGIAIEIAIHLESQVEYLFK